MILIFTFETVQAELAKTKLKEASARAEAEGAVVAQEILAQREQVTADVCKSAYAKLPEAADYLVGRVVSGAC